MNLYKAEAVVKTYHKLSKLKLGQIKAQGWLKSQLERARDGIAGHLDELEPNIIGRAFVDPTYRNDAEDDLTSYHGRQMAIKNSLAWSGEQSGEYWMGVVETAYILDDPYLKEKAAKWVKSVLTLQAEDGYIGNYYDRSASNPYEFFGNVGHCRVYSALLSYYEVTGDKTVLDALHKALLYITRTCTDEQKDSYCGSVLVECMVPVYVYTGDERLYQWCEGYMEWHNEHDPDCHSTAGLERDVLNNLTDHIGATGENIKVPAIFYCANGNERYLNASLKGLDKLMDKSGLPNGGPATCTEFTCPGSVIFHNENCNFVIFNYAFTWLAMATGQAKYGDYMEKIIYNGLQGARANDERTLSYMSYINQFSTDNYWGEKYQPAGPTLCCYANAGRGYPEFIRAMCMLDEVENLYFLAYGPCSIHFTDTLGTEISIEEETCYPFRENITLKVSTDKPIARKLHLKIPAWCKNYSVHVNGKAVHGEIRNGFIALDHTWNNDTVEIFFEMKPVVRPMKDVYFPNEDLAVVECGALIFSLQPEEKWTEIPGETMTPLPEDWKCYKVDYVMSKGDGTGNIKGGLPFHYSIDRALYANACTIERVESEGFGNPWEEKPLKLSVPLHKSPYIYRGHTPHGNFATALPFENPALSMREEQQMELVPYGSTTLRLTCFTICKYDDEKL